MNEMKRILLGMLTVLLLFGIGGIGSAIAEGPEYLWGAPEVIVSGQIDVGDLATAGRVRIYDGLGGYSDVFGAAPASLWSRVGDLLSPSTADVRVYVEATAAGQVIYAGNNGAGAGVYGYSYSGVGVEGASASGNAVTGTTESAGNTTYSLAALPGASVPARLLLGRYADITGAATFDDPDSGYARFSIAGDGKPHCKVNIGGSVTDYDLTTGGAGMTSWTATADWGDNLTVVDSYALDFIGGTGIDITGAAGAQSLDFDLADTAVSPASYTLASITVDQQGRITAAASGATPAPVGAQYLALAADATLTVERVFTLGVGVTGVDSGAGAAYTLAAPITAGAGIAVTNGGAGTANSVASLAPWITVWKTSDEALQNDSTVNNDSTLLFSYASGYYTWRARIYYETSATADFKYAVAWSANLTRTNWNYNSIAPQALPGSGTLISGISAASGTGATVLGGAGAGYVELSGAFNASDAGTLNFQWAQNTADNNPGLAVSAGSYLEYRKVS